MKKVYAKITTPLRGQLKLVDAKLGSRKKLFVWENKENKYSNIGFDVIIYNSLRSALVHAHSLGYDVTVNQKWIGA